MGDQPDIGGKGAIVSDGNQEKMGRVKKEISNDIHIGPDL
jgi:hypothetical protein